MVPAQVVRSTMRYRITSERSSKPIFTVEKYGLSSFIDIAVRYSGQIAVLADSPEIRIAHEYAVMLARLRGVNVRTFRDEATAVEWLRNGPPEEGLARPNH